MLRYIGASVAAAVISVNSEPSENCVTIKKYLSATDTVKALSSNGCMQLFAENGQIYGSIIYEN